MSKLQKVSPKMKGVLCVKRLVALFLVVVLVLSMSAVFAEDAIFGQKFRFEGGELDHVILWEPEDNHQFVEIDQFQFDINERLGYLPKFYIDYEEQKVYIWLYQTELEIDCLVDKQTERVILPDVWFDDDVYEANELYSLFDKDEYTLHELDNEEYEIIEAEKSEMSQLLKITVLSHVDGEDGKTFTVSTLDFKADFEKGTYVISQEGFRQLWYEIHGRY